MEFDMVCLMVNTIEAALRKQIPLDYKIDDNGDALCPVCGAEAELHKYCEECGQALDEYIGDPIDAEALEMAIEALTHFNSNSNAIKNELNDTISRQDAIDAIHCDITVTGRQNAELVSATIATFVDRIKALPSAQPEIKTDGDTISRQAAIGIVVFECGKWTGLAKEISKQLKQLPSAQPEIIRCKDCRHGVDYYHEGDCYCSNPKWGLKYFGGSWEFYCADAERRTDEAD